MIVLQPSLAADAASGLGASPRALQWSRRALRRVSPKCYASRVIPLPSGRHCSFAPQLAAWAEVLIASTFNRHRKGSRRLTASRRGRIAGICLRVFYNKIDYRYKWGYIKLWIMSGTRRSGYAPCMTVASIFEMRAGFSTGVRLSPTRRHAVGKTDL